MRLIIAVLSTISALVALAPTCNGYSLNKKGLFGPDLKILSQKEAFRNDNAFAMSTTRRETIKMPSQTPMVPWKVRNYYDKLEQRRQTMSLVLDSSYSIASSSDLVSFFLVDDE
jgi:hypothetical protein